MTSDTPVAIVGLLPGDSTKPLMFLSKSAWRKTLVTALAVLGFAYLFEVSMLDSRPFNKIRALQREQKRTSPITNGGQAGLSLPVLQFKQLVVDAPLRKQLLVATGFAQLPVMQHQDRVHVLDGREPVSNGDRRPARHQRA